MAAERPQQNEQGAEPDNNDERAVHRARRGRPPVGRVAPLARTEKHPTIQPVCVASPGARAPSCRSTPEDSDRRPATSRASTAVTCPRSRSSSARCGRPTLQHQSPWYRSPTTWGATPTPYAPPTKSSPKRASTAIRCCWMRTEPDRVRDSRAPGHRGGPAQGLDVEQESRARGQLDQPRQWLAGQPRTSAICAPAWVRQALLGLPAMQRRLHPPVVRGLAPHQN